MKELGIDTTKPLTLQNQYGLDCLSFAERNAKLDPDQAANVDRIANIYNSQYARHVSPFWTTVEQPDWPVRDTMPARISALRQAENLEQPPFSNHAKIAEEYGITQEQLAQALAYIPGNNYRQQPGINAIRKIANFHNVSVEYLIDGILPTAIVTDLHDVVKRYVAKQTAINCKN